VQLISAISMQKTLLGLRGFCGRCWACCFGIALFLRIAAKIFGENMACITSNEKGEGKKLPKARECGPAKPLWSSSAIHIELFFVIFALELQFGIFA
jgi:hypothetical protein